MPDLPLTAEQTKGLKDSIDTRVKALESSSQLEMIQLQSLMSARQAAVSMCTNLVSALGKADEAIANNIGH
jgi:hypothetical protein